MRKNPENIAESIFDLLKIKMLKNTVDLIRIYLLIRNVFIIAQQEVNMPHIKIKIRKEKNQTIIIIIIIVIIIIIIILYT